MDVEAFFRSELREHAAVVAEAERALAGAFAAMLRSWVETARRGGTFLFFGNGGSAGDAQHLAAELTVRYRQDRAPIAAIALTTDSSALTAIGNDLGFERLFARQVEALGRPGDLALGITTSGRSPNVIAALRQARAQGLVAAALTGGDAGDLRGLAEPLIVVPSTVTARIQELHITLGQMLCAALERELGLVP